MGANAVVMMRYDSAEIGQTMSEIVVYGTAAVIEPVAMACLLPFGAFLAPSLIWFFSARAATSGARSTLRPAKIGASPASAFSIRRPARRLKSGIAESTGERAYVRARQGSRS